MTEIEINIPLKIKVGDKIDVVDLIKQINDLELNKTALKEVIEKADKNQTEEISGDKNKPENDKKQVKAGTRPVRIMTDYGEVCLNLHRIKENNITRTVINDIQSGHVYFTPEFKDKVRGMIPHTTYRRVTDIINTLRGQGFNKDMIWNIVRELGIKSSETYSVNANEYDVIMIDGSGGKGKHQWYLLVGLNLKNGKMHLLHHSVGISVSEIKEELKNKGLLRKDHIIIADGETGIHRSFNEYRIQMCAFHFEMNLGYQLWSDGLKFSDRKPYVKEIRRIMSTLKNSVTANVKTNPKKLSNRIDQTIIDLTFIANELKNNGLNRACRFVKKHITTVILFAQEALKYVKIPWTNNIMERFIGEVTFRIKNRWAHWGEIGLNSIIYLIATKFCDRNKVVMQF